MVTRNTRFTQKIGPLTSRLSRSFKVVESDTGQVGTYELHSVIHGNHVPFPRWMSYWLKNANFYNPRTKLHLGHSLLLLWLAPLRVCSATGCQQPPEWSVLGQVDCIGPWQPVGVEVVLHHLPYTRNFLMAFGLKKTERWSYQIVKETDDTYTVQLFWHSINALGFVNRKCTAYLVSNHWQY